MEGQSPRGRGPWMELYSTPGSTTRCVCVCVAFCAWVCLCVSCHSCELGAISLWKIDV